MRLGSLVLITLLLTCGCGFHLRTFDLTSTVSSAYVTSNTRNFLTEPLRTSLRQVGVNEASSAGEAELVVQLVEQRRERRSVSVTGAALAAEYELTLGVRFSVFNVSDGQQNVLIEPRWAQITRLYRIDPNNLVGSSEEQALLEREMVADLVAQVIRALNAVSRETGIAS
ncbi:MAG: LPS assembly lipoprotein LptE [Gammaproteobacteria bacterium]|nr:LPS assembly lipoprotein LptE [Gammaproteobacteria bacterium]